MENSQVESKTVVGNTLTELAKKQVKYTAKSLSKGSIVKQYMENVGAVRRDVLKERGYKVKSYGFFRGDTLWSIIAFILSFAITLFGMVVIGTSTLMGQLIGVIALTYVLNLIPSLVNHKKSKVYGLIYALSLTTLAPIIVQDNYMKKEDKKIERGANLNKDYRLRGREEKQIYNQLNAILVFKTILLGDSKYRGLPISHVNVDKILKSILDTEYVSKEDLDHEVKYLINMLNQPIEVMTSETELGYMTYLYNIIYVNDESSLSFTTLDFNVGEGLKDVELKEGFIEETKLDETRLYTLVEQYEEDVERNRETKQYNEAINGIETSEELRQRKLDYIKQNKEKYEKVKQMGESLVGVNVRRDNVKEDMKNTEDKLNELSEQYQSIAK